jgi:hypothetical protein
MGVKDLNAEELSHSKRRHMNASLAHCYHIPQSRVTQWHAVLTKKPAVFSASAASQQ